MCADRSAKAGDMEVSLGDMVALTGADEDEDADVAGPQLGMVQALWQTTKAKMMQASYFSSWLLGHAALRLPELESLARPCAAKMPEIAEGNARPFQELLWSRNWILIRKAP